MAFVRENAADEFADVVFVVDDQDIGSHQDDPAFCVLRLGGVADRRPTSGSFISTIAPAAAVGAGEPVEQLDPAAVVLEDLDDDRQAEPGALRARRHVGLDQAIAVLAREALAVVADGDLDEAADVGLERHEDAPALAVLAERVDAFRRS